MRKYLIYILLALVFALIVIGAFWTDSMIKSHTPPFILEKLQELREDKRLMDSIGGFDGFEYKYNKNDYERGDTLNYSILIEGKVFGSQLSYQGTHARDSISGGWLLISDTLDVQ
jgi:hypothetical protein